MYYLVSINRILYGTDFVLVLSFWCNTVENPFDTFFNDSIWNNQWGYQASNDRSITNISQFFF